MVGGTTVPYPSYVSEGRVGVSFPLRPYHRVVSTPPSQTPAPPTRIASRKITPPSPVPLGRPRTFLTPPQPPPEVPLPSPSSGALSTRIQRLEEEFSRVARSAPLVLARAPPKVLRPDPSPRDSCSFPPAPAASLAESTYIPSPPPSPPTSSLCLPSASPGYRSDGYTSASPPATPRHHTTSSEASERSIPPLAISDPTEPNKASSGTHYTSAVSAPNENLESPRETHSQPKPSFVSRSSNTSWSPSPPREPTKECCAAVSPSCSTHTTHPERCFSSSASVLEPSALTSVASKPSALTSIASKPSVASNPDALLFTQTSTTDHQPSPLSSFPSPDCTPDQLLLGLPRSEESRASHPGDEHMPLEQLSEHHGAGRVAGHCDQEAMPAPAPSPMSSPCTSSSNGFPNPVSNSSSHKSVVSLPRLRNRRPLLLRRGRSLSVERRCAADSPSPTESTPPTDSASSSRTASFPVAPIYQAAVESALSRDTPPSPPPPQPSSHGWLWVFIVVAALLLAVSRPSRSSFRDLVIQRHQGAHGWLVGSSIAAWQHSTGSLSYLNLLCLAVAWVGGSHPAAFLGIAFMWIPLPGPPLAAVNIIVCLAVWGVTKVKAVRECCRWIAEWGGLRDTSTAVTILRNTWIHHDGLLLLSNVAFFSAIAPAASQAIRSPLLGVIFFFTAGWIGALVASRFPGSKFPGMTAPIMAFMVLVSSLPSSARSKDPARIDVLLGASFAPWQLGCLFALVTLLIHSSHLPPLIAGAGTGLLAAACFLGTH